MIKNEKQYQITKTRMHEFEQSLATIQAAELDPLMRLLQEGAIKSQLEDFKKEIAEYELLKSGVSVINGSLHDFPETLIKGRIARGWSQADLAAKLGMKEQQIQRYEGCNYATASFARILEIAESMQMHGDIKARLHTTELEVPGIDHEQMELAKQKLRNQKSLLAA